MMKSKYFMIYHLKFNSIFYNLTKLKIIRMESNTTTPTAVTENEYKAILKKLEMHLIKTIIGALVIAILGAGLTSLSFYYNTKSTINELKTNAIQTTSDVKALSTDVNTIKSTLSITGIYTTESIDKVKKLETDVSTINTNIGEIYKILYEIKGKQK